MGRHCFVCNKEIEDDYRMIGVDKPYVNLFFHKACLSSVGDLSIYLVQNAKRVYNYKENSEKSRKLRKKWAK
jgi:hypothetical protein